MAASASGGAAVFSAASASVARRLPPAVQPLVSVPFVGQVWTIGTWLEIVVLVVCARCERLHACIYLSINPYIRDLPTYPSRSIYPSFDIHPPVEIYPSIHPSRLTYLAVEIYLSIHRDLSVL
jgi:hypothetical protein